MYKESSAIKLGKDMRLHKFGKCMVICAVVREKGIRGVSKGKYTYSGVVICLSLVVCISPSLGHPHKSLYARKVDGRAYVIVHVV